jgi:catalase-peroxidase
MLALAALVVSASAGSSDNRRERLRALSVTAGQTNGVLTDRPGTLTNDVFVNLIDMSAGWEPISDAPDAFEGCCRKKGHRKMDRQPSRSRVRANSELRAAPGAVA